MLDRLVDGLGLNRWKLKDAYDQAEEIDSLDRFLDGLDAPPRRRTRRKP
jgi:hypothetical protein